ncbi:GH39 family glycosyl hydrolase [Algoriphagus yeomjeoni]|uniref:Xylan 1,4-beta-xylosidase n=1 Tax=Algoriphagus yeomjeoni TaxID=291403 RepID=A0A327P9U6_9BACT|nr:beta-xylosidase [Algoriphagus yeomjeoni]RAI87914.1 xylan 1,4-beta-xylosidase [Algoriphagus yeomjeoni]
MTISKTFLSVLCILLPFIGEISAQSADNPIEIEVDFASEKGPMNPVWAWWGYDEPNYTYMKDGKKLLGEIAELSPVPVYVRAHSLLVTDEGPRAALKWGSTNVYTEDEQGNPVYDWTVIDQIFDTYIERGMKPFAQIGFMPKALSSKPEPYRHFWKPGAKYEEIYTGWAYPPNDYEKFAELVFQWVKHSIDRYGKEEVESWYWELWNEPNIGYWQGTTEEYIKLYDYSADAVKRALPTAKVGGPEGTGPGWDKAAEFLTTFLDHVKEGTNYATGKKGTPLDFITFHAKGSPKVVDGIVQMNMGAQLNDIEKGFEIVASYPEFKNLPIIIGESDPEGCAACSEADYPHNAYRNGTMYSSYTAASFARKYALADEYGVNLLGAVTWGFEFENQAWFAGFRDMATNGVNKPVLNVFRMFGMMGGNRVEVSGDLAYDHNSIIESGVRGERTDVNALATKSENSASIMLWNYHDDNTKIGDTTSVEMRLKGLVKGKMLLEHFIIDQKNSNSYALWLKMGSPQNPTADQIAQLEEAGQLKLAASPKWITTEKGETILKLDIERQGVSLLRFTW